MLGKNAHGWTAIFGIMVIFGVATFTQACLQPPANQLVSTPLSAQVGTSPGCVWVDQSFCNYSCANPLCQICPQPGSTLTYYYTACEQPGAANQYYPGSCVTGYNQTGQPPPNLYAPTCTCPTGQHYDNGICCLNGWKNCGGTCINVSGNDNSNCGDCGRICPTPSYQCTNGNCV